MPWKDPSPNSTFPLAQASWEDLDAQENVSPGLTRLPGSSGEIAESTIAEVQSLLTATTQIFRQALGEAGVGSKKTNAVLRKVKAKSSLLHLSGISLKGEVQSFRASGQSDRPSLK